MARRQAEDYEEKRAAIVEAAARLFAAKGFSGASLADLADACDMSKSLFYHYYPSKEAILYAVMKGHMDDLLTAIGEAQSEHPVYDLRGFARRLLRLYAGAADKQKVLLYELANLPPAQRRDIVAKERRLVAHVEGIIKRARPRQEKGHLRAQAMLFFGMLNWTHTWLKDDGPVYRDEAADMAARMTLAKYG
ncbi:MAG: TetR/AcrR family transcriptional regulator [Parvularculaceae bacterium]|nr:TetR/AcrR family transcriptional regulator [Parvularculaceae bacterium]